MRWTWRKKAFYSLVVTAMFFVCLEVLLALLGVERALYDEDPFVGFSSYIPLYVDESGSEGVAVTTAKNKLGWFNEQRFLKDKPAGTFRIFCVGGSTTYGRPYDDATSFAGWLREFLPLADPSRRWEVINAGGISYASYRVAKLMEELIRYEPDLFIVYSGQNEFLERRTYGAMLEIPDAVHGLTALLGQTRTWTAIAGLMGRGAKKRSEGTPGVTTKRYELPEEVETLLDGTVGPDAYTRDETLETQVLAHYRFNVGRMVDIARAAGARILLVTPASNLGSCSPFKSEHREGLSETDRDRWQKLFDRAERQLADRRLDGALASLDEAATIDDRFAHLQYLRGRTLRELSRSTEAKTAFMRARDEDVCPLRALTPMRGIVTDVAKDRGVPVVDFVALVDARSRDGIPDEQLFLDHVHPTIEGHRMLALAIVEQLERAGIVPEPPESWNEDAIEAVKRTIEAGLDPVAHGIALRNLAKVLSWAGKFEEAEPLVERAARLVPDDATTLQQAGMVLAERGRTEEAVSHYLSALRIEPENPTAHYSLGLAYLKQGDLDRAAAHFELAVRYAPEYSAAHGSLGLVLRRQGKLEDAVRRLERALEIDPADARTLTSLGNTLLEQGRKDQARARYEEALTVDPRYAEAHYNLGLWLADEGEPEEAIVQLESATRLQPDLVEAHVSLGRLYFRQKRTDDAVARYEAALAVDPGLAIAHYNLGVLWYSEGNLEKAADHYEQALRSDPEHAGAHNNLGIIRARQGNASQAVAHFERALAIRPDYADARGNLEKAKSLLRDGR